jgi:uncharacterized iron-regulated protein
MEVTMRRLTIGLVSVLMSVASADAAELDLLPLGDEDRAHQLASAEAGSAYDTRAGERLDESALLDRLARGRVVLMGEEHTAMEQKLLHERVLRGLVERNGNVVLGMEFFLRSDREALDRWSAGALDDDGLLREVGWYDRGSYRWEYYAPVMHAARELGVPVVGLNVDRDIVRAVNRGGLDGLSEAQREEVGPVDVGGSDDHRYLIARYFGETVGLLPPEWFENMYAAQCVWDVAMARSILAELPEDGTMLVIVGAGHVAYDVGISRRIADERRSAGLDPIEAVTFVPVTAPAPDPEGDPMGHPMSAHGGGAPEDRPAQFVRSLADVVGVFAPTGGIEAYPTVGLRLGVGEDGMPAVQMIWPDTRASHVDFEFGDRVLDLNGARPDDLSHLRRMVAHLEWGERAGFLIRRGDEVLEVALLLVPDTVDLEREVAPGYTVEAVTGLDLDDASAVRTSDDLEEPTTVRVSRGGNPLRVEVRTGEVVDEVHELDADGRVVRSLYRMPRSDGAVEVRRERDASGVVVSVTRIDRAGAVIG